LGDAKNWVIFQMAGEIAPGISDGEMTKSLAERPYILVGGWWFQTFFIFP